MTHRSDVPSLPLSQLVKAKLGLQRVVSHPGWGKSRGPLPPTCRCLDEADQTVLQRGASGCTRCISIVQRWRCSEILVLLSHWGNTFSVDARLAKGICLLPSLSVFVCAYPLCLCLPCFSLSLAFNCINLLSKPVTNTRQLMPIRTWTAVLQ